MGKRKYVKRPKPKGHAKAKAMSTTKELRVSMENLSPQVLKILKEKTAIRLVDFKKLQDSWNSRRLRHRTRLFRARFGITIGEASTSTSADAAQPVAIMRASIVPQPPPNPWNRMVFRIGDQEVEPDEVSEEGSVVSDACASIDSISKASMDVHVDELSDQFENLSSESSDEEPALNEMPVLVPVSAEEVIEASNDLGEPTLPILTPFDGVSARDELVDAVNGETATGNAKTGEAAAGNAETGEMPDTQDG